MEEDDEAAKAVKGVVPKSVAARVRALMPEIEAKLSAGVTHEDMVRTLNDAGIPVTFLGFRQTLYRDRKRRDAATAASIGVAAVAVAPDVPSEATIAPLEDRRPAAVEEAPADTARALTEALDPRKRAEAADKYLTQPRRPLLRPKQQG